MFDNLHEKLDRNVRQGKGMEMRTFGFLLALSLMSMSSSSAFGEQLAIVGTGDGMPVFKTLGSAFTSENPDIEILVPPSIHSSGGVREVVADRAVLGRIARPLKDDEQNYGIRVVPVFRQPAIFYAHPSVSVKSLSADQLTKIFTGVVTNWREVGGPDLRIRVVRREEVDSILAVFRDTLPGWKDLHFDVDRSMLATSTQQSFDAVRSRVGAIGFGPFSVGLESTYIVMRVNGIAPTDAAYPSAVTLSLIYKDANLSKSADRFIDFIFSPTGIKVIKENGGLPVVRAPK